MAEASSLNGKWSNHGKIATLRPNGSRRANRHGTVIRITDPTAKQKLYTLWTGKPAPASTGGLLEWIKSLSKQIVEPRP